MHIRYRLLQHLADGRFHSGQQLAQQYGISRSAVWKHIQQIRQQHAIECYSIKGKGYRLAQSLDLLDESSIRQQLSHSVREALDRITVHQAIDSTNSWMMQEAKQTDVSHMVCFAEQQSAGRGRRGRQWVSPFGNNIYLSLLWRFNLAPSQLTGLSLAMAIGVLRSLDSAGIDGVGLKWPNDIIWQGRKLSGLLLEVMGEAGGPSSVVIGVGINTRLQESDAAAIDQPWVDLASLPGGDMISRNHLAASVLEHLVRLIWLFEKDGLISLIDEWNQRDMHRDCKVVLKNPTQSLTGFHRGINEQGALLLEIDGKLNVVVAGELSLREHG